MLALFSFCLCAQISLTRVMIVFSFFFFFFAYRPNFLPDVKLIILLLLRFPSSHFPLLSSFLSLVWKWELELEGWSCGQNTLYKYLYKCDKVQVAIKYKIVIMLLSISIMIFVWWILFIPTLCRCGQSYISLRLSGNISVIIPSCKLVVMSIFCVNVLW